MTRTPWGNADELRARRLRPGPTRAPHLVALNQRERLFAATVAAVDEHGYEALRVEDIVALSGVSRSAFYRHFSNKQDCFLATFDAILAEFGDAIGQAAAAEDAWDRRIGAALEALVDTLVDQPSAARLCLVEADAAGPEAVERLEALVARVERLVKRALAGSPERTGMPADLVRGIVGGIHQTIHTRLRRGEEGALPALVPELLEWALAYRTPAEPLRRPRIRPARPAQPPAPDDHAVERLLAGVTATTAERGYPATTVIELATAGRASLSTFYANFDTKEDAFLAAIDRARDHAFDAACRACDEADDWRQGVREGLDAIFGVLASDPPMARLTALEVNAAGLRALERRDLALADIQALLESRATMPADGGGIVFEAIAGALLSLVHDQARHRRPERMRELTPVATFVTLSPFLGGEEALAVASPGTA